MFLPLFVCLSVRQITHNWKSAQVVNSHLVCDPTVRQPGFDLPRQQLSLLNRFRIRKCYSAQELLEFLFLCSVDILSTFSDELMCL